ncbi:Hachiman antiphage defense system protein HamA [Arcanobacterium phocae]|uniref:Hachiman antiphage defense system protein HamA n=1 Tax=Arcanobacterium phocae TaxID=131112 RepID=UPI00344FA133
MESKAGSPSGKQNTSTAKAKERINFAKRDLNKRLNSTNSQLWLNAINSVRSALDDSSEKETIVNILNDTSSSNSSTDKNVILSGTVFCKFDCTIDETQLEKVYQSILHSNAFSNVRLIAIQKQTYQAIVDFLSTLT